MGVNYNPKSITDGLVFALDMANPKCYATAFGSKTGGMIDLSLDPVGTGHDIFHWDPGGGGGATFVNDGNRSHFHFDRSASERMAFENDHGGSHHLLTKMGHSGSGTEALPFTIEFVIRIETAPSGIGGDGYAVIRSSTSNQIGCHIRNNTSTAGTGAVNIGYVGQGNNTNNNSPVVPGEWYYGAVTRDNGANGAATAKFYDKNGLSKTATGQNLQTAWSTDNMLIGGPHYMEGDIALVRVYKRDLTAAEVAQNFDSLRGRFDL